MSRNNIRRINEDIQRVISSLLGSVKDPRLHQGMVSVTRVDTTQDLRYAKIYISVLGQFDEKELARGLKSASGFLRRELGQKLSLRYTPELIFELDGSIAYGARISKILNDLDVSGGEDEPCND